MSSLEHQPICVIVVSDFEGAEGKLWKDEEVMLEALAQQDFTEPFEVMLVENKDFQEQVPKRLFNLTSGLDGWFNRAITHLDEITAFLALVRDSVSSKIFAMQGA